MFCSTFPRPALVHSTLGHIVWGFSLGNSYFPEIRSLFMNLEDQVHTSVGLYKIETENTEKNYRN